MITFVATAFNEQFDYYTFIGSLLCQTNSNWKAIIYVNGSEHAETAYNKCRQILDYENKCVNKISFKYSENNTGHWGCLNRQDCIDRLVDTEYIIQTSIQDYWMPNAVEEISKRKEDFIYWNSINHIVGYTTILNSSLGIGGIDWGNFAVKTSIAKQIGITKPDAHAADGIFVLEGISKNLIKTTYKIPLILTVHN